MDASTLFLTQHAGMHGVAVRGRGRPTLADRTFGELTDAQMRLRPAPAANSLAWLLWHMARAEDLFVNTVLFARPQVLADGWSARLEVAPVDIGTGMTAAEAAALADGVDLPALREYRDAVGRRTREIVAAMAPADWEGRVEAADVQRAVDAGGFGPNAGGLAAFFTGWPRAALLSSIAVLHPAQHLGEAATVRSLGGSGLDA
jgi:hypothetical protein